MVVAVKKGTPDAVVQKLLDASKAAMDNDEFRASIPRQSAGIGCMVLKIQRDPIW